MLFLALMVHALALFSVMVFFPRVRGIDYTFFRGVIDKNAHLPAVASARRSLQPGTGPSALVKPVPFWGLRMGAGLDERSPRAWHSACDGLTATAGKCAPNFRLPPANVVGSGPGQGTVERLSEKIFLMSQFLPIE